MSGNGTFEVVIGLEVHAQLRTRTKLFSPAPVSFGAEPNHSVSPVCLALKGNRRDVLMNGVSFRKGTSLDLHAQNEPFVRTYCGKGYRTLVQIYNKCKFIHKKKGLGMCPIAVSPFMSSPTSL